MAICLLLVDWMEQMTMAICRLLAVSLEQKMQAVKPGEINVVIFRVNSFPYQTGINFRVATDCVKKLACLNVTLVRHIVGFKDH